MLTGRIFLAVSSLVLARVSTMLLSPAEIGRYNILQTITFFLSLIIVTPISVYFNRKTVEWNLEGKSKSYLTYYIILLFPLCLLGAIGIMLYNRFYGIGIQISSLVLFLFVLFVPFISGIQNVIVTTINYLEHRLTYVFLTNVGNWGGLILASFLAIYIFPVGEIWLLGQQLVLVVVCVLGYLSFKKIIINSEVKLSFKESYLTDETIAISTVFKYSAPYAGAMILYWLQNYCYQLILNYNSSAEQVGLFATGVKIGQTPLTILDAVLFQYFISFYFKDIANADSFAKAKAWNKFAGKIIPLVFPVVVAVIASSESMTIILVDKKFAASSSFVIWGAATEGLRIFSTIISQVAIAEMKTKILFWYGFIPTSVTLGIQVVFIKYNPALASGWSLFLGMLTTVLVGYYAAKKLLPVSFPWKKIVINALFSLPLVILIFFRTLILDYLFSFFGINGWHHFLSPLIFLSVTGVFLGIPFIITFKANQNDRV